MEKWFVYIIECEDKSLYTGSTNNLKTRFEKHKSGKGAKYTRSHIPEKIVFYREYRSKILAQRKEREIKNLTHDEKIELIASTL